MAVFRRIVSTAATLGFNPYLLAETVRNAPRFFRELRAYRRLSAGDATFPLALEDLEPVLADYRAQAGIARGHYFHQDLWAARKILARRPAHHVDVGSRVDGFVAHVLTAMPVRVIDIRPLDSDVDGLTFQQGDATDLRGIATGSIESLSSLHAVEHIGLGRYGDSVDPDGWRKALGEFRRVLAPGGRLYLSVPVGRQRVCFNAHRIFDPRTIVEACAPLSLASFSAVGDDDRLRRDVPLDSVASARYACGLFEFQQSE
jgi:hypothetical protein